MSTNESTVSARQILADCHRIVIKVGSSLLTEPGVGLARDTIRRYCDEIAQAGAMGKEILLVSSGAVAEGCTRLGWNERPDTIHELQAAAAVGQMGLAQAYESGLAEHDIVTAIVMLTHDDVADRQRYLNARATLTELGRLGVVPVINENDTVATDEIRFGDNDTLAALVANLVEADLLVILTDVEGLMDKDPGVHADAELVHEANAQDKTLDGLPSEAVGVLGRGGMVTKLKAARMAARSGAHTLIMSGHQPLTRIFAGERVGTLLTADLTPITARKRWIAGQLRSSGTLNVDAGAAGALKTQGVSLLAVGVVGVEGTFGRGDVVRIASPDGVTVAQGLSNYSSDEVRKLKGAKSDKFADLIGYAGEPELVHRDNLVVV